MALYVGIGRARDEGMGHRDTRERELGEVKGAEVVVGRAIGRVWRTEPKHVLREGKSGDPGWG